MTSWNFSNIHNQTGVLTKSSTGTWTYVPTDGDNPDNEYLTVTATTVTWKNIGEYQDHARYSWPASHSTGDIVSTNGTAITGFTHNWGHTSLGGSELTITQVQSGPTVTSITDDTIFVPSDTVSNTDFTLLKNGSAYSNTNISLTGPGAQPPSDARGYTYALTYDVSAYYDVTIDSKTFFGSYYDDSWSSSPTSGRNPQSTSSRILNVIAVIPSRAIHQSIDGVATVHLGTLTHNSRILTYVKNIYVSGSQTHTLTVKFYIDQKTINGTDEIVGTFSSKIEQYPPAIDGRSFNAFDYVIGAQQAMTHTINHGGKTYVFSIQDWIYEDEPEGDGYVAPVTTTSNGGGKPDRYPLIMTNLFNRNRSLYSIGMTHKDTWDLFL